MKTSSKTILIDFVKLRIAQPKRASPMVLSVCVASIGLSCYAADKSEQAAHQSATVVKDGPAKAPSKDARRVLEFPSYPIGKIFAAPKWNVTSKRNDGTLLAVAKGPVSVPANDPLVLKLDYYVQVHPDALKVPESNIVEIDGDRLALEDSICPAIARISSVQRVDFASSEISDGGLKILAKMDSLRCIIVDRSMVEGSCLQALGAAKSLIYIDLGQNAIKPQFFKDFACLTKLAHAKLIGLAFTDDSLKYVGQMKSLEDLSLKKNAKLTSAGMKYLLALKKLRQLDLQETNVGMEGIELLMKNLNMTFISVNADLVTSDQRQKLRAKYPKTALVFSAKRDTPETHSLFAPLK